MTRPRHIPEPLAWLWAVNRERLIRAFDAVLLSVAVWYLVHVFGGVP